MDRYTNRLQAAVESFGQLVVGIDPSESTLADWGMNDTAQSARDFGYEIIAACEERIGIIKTQVAFFERFGSAGYLALEDIMEAAREANLLVIADAKRGDIGSTMQGYAQAWFGDDSPLRSDALTLSPYLGPSSLSDTIEAARDVKAGVFILAATSNPEAKQLQQAKGNGRTVSDRILRFAAEHSAGDVGIVVGATVNLAEFGIEEIRERDIQLPILAPGFGAQGAKLSQLGEIFGASSQRVLANVSRSVVSGGVGEIVNQIEKLKAEL